MPPPWPVASPPAKRPVRWLVVFTSLGIALLALGVGISAWFRPLPDNKSSGAPPPPTYTDQQVNEAKATVCAAFEEVHHAIHVSSARDRGNDPTANLAFAVNARQALVAGSEYLLMKLSEEPATSRELADAVRKLAGLYENLTLNFLAEVSDPEMEPLLRAGDEATSTVQRLCK